jgi:NO-binding membrane sensor protein with MHYT domain
MTQLVLGASMFFIGVAAFTFSMPAKGRIPKLAISDNWAAVVAVVITTLLSLGLGLLATSIFTMFS